MSNENIQPNRLKQDDIQYSMPLTRQGLLMDAFMTDKAIWTLDKDRTEVGLVDAQQALAAAEKKVEQEHWFIRFIYNKILRRLSPAEKALEEARQQVIDFYQALIDIYKREPKSNLYELAMLGNNIFKPR